MKAKKIISLPMLILSCLILLSACFNSNMTVQTSPPPRTISLDSVDMDLGPLKLKPEADSFLINFIVYGDSSCPVKIEFKTSQHEVIRLITDSIYSPGAHIITWSRVDTNGVAVKYHLPYYYDISICDKSSTKSFYYRREVY